jgi:hypothetical protein
MASENDDRRPESEAASESPQPVIRRQPYTSPRLRKLGTVAELTRNAGLEGGDGLAGSQL